MLKQTGLVLEGGGMRGVYTGGVLEYFMEAGIQFPYVVAVSAGACNAASYLSRQKGRNKKVTIDYVDHPRYISLWNLFRERSVFGMNLIFDELPNRLEPFDFEAFYREEAAFWVGMTDAVTGEAVYADKRSLADRREMLNCIRASSSLPFAAPPIVQDGRILFDGGIVDPIPLRKSIADGNVKHVVVLTKPEGYRKKPFKHSWLARRVYPRYPGLIDALARRYRVYNESLELVEDMSRKGQTLIIRPSTPLGVGRMTKDKSKLIALYELGYRDAERCMNEWRELPN